METQDLQYMQSVLFKQAKTLEEEKKNTFLRYIKGTGLDEIGKAVKRKGLPYAIAVGSGVGRMFRKFLHLATDRVMTSAFLQKDQIVFIWGVQHQEHTEGLWCVSTTK